MRQLDNMINPFLSWSWIGLLTLVCCWECQVYDVDHTCSSCAPHCSVPTCWRHALCELLSTSCSSSRSLWCAPEEKTNRVHWLLRVALNIGKAFIKPWRNLFIGFLQFWTRFTSCIIDMVSQSSKEFLHFHIAFKEDFGFNFSLEWNYLCFLTILFSFA